MANQRVYYAIQQCGIGTQGQVNFGSAETIYGLQTVGITTRFNLEQVFVQVS
jgi:hypothetical protein